MRAQHTASVFTPETGQPAERINRTFLSQVPPGLFQLCLTACPAEPSPPAHLSLSPAHSRPSPFFPCVLVWEHAFMHVMGVRVQELGLREDSNSRQVPLLYTILARLQHERSAPQSLAPVCVFLRVCACACAVCSVCACESLSPICCTRICFVVTAEMGAFSSSTCMHMQARAACCPTVKTSARAHARTLMSIRPQANAPYVGTVLEVAGGGRQKAAAGAPSAGTAPSISRGTGVGSERAVGAGGAVGGGGGGSAYSDVRSVKDPPPLTLR